MSQKEYGSKSEGFLRQPLSERGWPKWVVYVLAAVGLVYVLNPTAGIFELLPDNIPGLGNIDEGLAYLLVYYGLNEFFTRKPLRPTRPNEDDVVDGEWEE